MSNNTFYFILALLVIPPFLIACFRSKFGVGVFGLFANFMLIGLLMEKGFPPIGPFVVALLVGGGVIAASKDP